MWSVLLIIGSVIVGIFLLILIVGTLHYNLRKKEVSDWQVGDIIILNRDAWIYGLKITSATLTGWNEDYIFIQNGTYIHKVSFSEVRMNKSAVWRRHYLSCEKYMGSKPSFNPSVKISHSKNTSTTISSSGMYNGKTIELLNEIECEIFLKECIANEDYETATLIRKRLEKFR
jgi:hypothetical protein